MNPSAPPVYDLSKLPSVYPDPSTLRTAYLTLARWALKADRIDDLTRIMRELTRAACAGLLGPTPIPNQSILMCVSGVDTIAQQTVNQSANSNFSFQQHHSNNQSNPPLPPVMNGPPQDPHDLSIEERNLLFTAYKQPIGTLRASWRAIHIECTTHLINQRLNPQTADGANPATNPNAYKLLDEYRCQLENEIMHKCNELTVLLDQTLIAVVQSPEAKVSYLKMAADFYRYLAEVYYGVTGIAPKHLIGPDRPPIQSVIPAGYEKKALEYYASAHKIAVSQLDPCHPARLGVCCNYSVLLYEICDEQKQACELARQSFDAAIARLDEMDETYYKQSTLIMQLLRDNISLWMTDDNQNGSQ